MSDGDWGALDVPALSGALTGGCEAAATDDAVAAGVPVPLVPRGASTALKPTSPVPCRKRRRVSSEDSSRGSRISSVIVSSGPREGDWVRSRPLRPGGGGGCGHHGRVIPQPEQSDRSPLAVQRAVDGPFHVLLVHGQARPRSRL